MCARVDAHVFTWPLKASSVLLLCVCVCVCVCVISKVVVLICIYTCVKRWLIYLFLLLG